MEAHSVVLRAACVLRSGGDFLPEHVGQLQAALARHLPGVPLICLSDIEVQCERILLQHDWPGWWAKMELMRPDIAGDLLYFDLDTVIVGDVSRFAALQQLTMLQDFYHPERLASGLMYLPAEDRERAWESWWSDGGPKRHMADCGIYGDQAFLGRLWGQAAARWQMVLPGQVVSYKVHVRPTGRVPDNARAVCFHGHPRPWQIKHDWIAQ